MFLIMIGSLVNEVTISSSSMYGGFNFLISNPFIALKTNLFPSFIRTLPASPFLMILRAKERIFSENFLISSSMLILPKKSVIKVNLLARDRVL